MLETRTRLPVQLTHRIGAAGQMGYAFRHSASLPANAWLLCVLAVPTWASTNHCASPAAFCACQAQQPKYSTAELQAGLDKAIDTAPLTPAEKIRLHAGATAENAQGPKDHLGWVVDGGSRIRINTPQLTGCAPPGSPAAVAVIAAICRHEIYHINPPSANGCGPDAGGVTNGTPDTASMCDHIGLQYWGAVQTCADAASAVAAHDDATADALCTLFRGQIGTLQHGGEYDVDAFHCHGWFSQPGGSSAGPPDWGFDSPPFPSNHGCEACLNHGGTGASQ